MAEAPQRKPTFFWQGVLILLPVTLMAAFSFWAIHRERNAVEQEARAQAQEILRALPTDFGAMIASRMTQFDAPQRGWRMYLERVLSRWPDSEERKQRLAASANDFVGNLAILRSVFPEWQAGPVPLVEVPIDANGIILPGHQPQPPRPPDWLADMSQAQYQAWIDLQSAAQASESFSNLPKLYETFRQALPPKPALLAAEFIQLRTESLTLPATDAINKLLGFAEEQRFVLSESGVPLSTLALAEALKRSQKVGPTERLWEALQNEVSSQSALTPILLDEAERLAAKNAALSEAVRAMRVVWAGGQAESEMAEALKQTGKLNGILKTNFWVDAMDRHWFCVPSSPEVYLENSISNHPSTAPESNMVVKCYPPSVVERGFIDAFREARISLPAYFGISIELAGEQISLPPPWGNHGKLNGDVLAEEGFQMWPPTISTNIDSGAVQQTKPAIMHLPAQTPFTLRILLTDRHRLYAKQTQLQYILGAIIAAAALAALFGFVTARNAFRHQRQLSEMKSNFVSSVSHELRAPIASVRLLAENLEQGKVLEPCKQDEYFHFIVQECQRLSSLIENILDFSRIEQGRKQYEFEPADLAALIQQTMKLMEPSAEDKGIVLEAALPGKIVSAEVDGKALQQALVNLIDNATKHSSKGSTVMIGLNDGLARFQIWVEDKGAGIPAAEQDRIFERFYRCGTELRRETQGVGIGLSIVKHIVEAHGGTIKVRSAVGQGSRFTIDLPKQTEENKKLDAKT